MSANEFINKEEADKLRIEEELQAKKDSKKKPKKSDTKSRSGGRIVVQIMNGDFLSKDWFIGHLPFTFFVAFLMVVMIGWGYYVETVIKTEVRLQEELGELESEFFTLNSEYNTKKGREQIIQKLPADGPKENRVAPKKIQVKNYVFD
jgi:hypothetical protein